jgi:aspartate aminotransferase-like enzyme
LPNPSIPRYLDLGNYFRTDGVPYTLSSNLLFALNKSLELLNIKKNRDFAYACSEIIRHRLENMGFEIVNDRHKSSPAIVTFNVRNNLSSMAVGEQLEKQNVYLSYRSIYLAERNLMQFALMGEFDYKDIELSLGELNNILSESKIINPV